MKAKKILAASCTVALVACLGVLSGCDGDSEPIAAKWANGEVTEASVTNQIEYMRSLYGFSSNLSEWEDFLKNRTYDTKASSNIEDVVSDDADSSDSSDADAKDTDAKDSDAADSSSDGAEGSDADQESTGGTVSDYRDYTIEQLVRNQVVEWEADQRGVAASDEEIDAALDEDRQQVEAQYMAGTFESVLESQTGQTIEEYRETLAKQLKVDKLQEQIVGVNDEDENWDQDKWDAFVDALMDYADMQINPMPSDLSYDPAVLQAAADATSTDATDAADGDDADGTATDAVQVVDDDASDEDDSDDSADSK